ncbi:hypothetical protein H0H92_013460 [Tricholoma furcatifolium]|nr:hypothetical protein H0H92_013460 [Tricholoma furcatifolium]
MSSISFLSRYRIYTPLPTSAHGQPSRRRARWPGFLILGLATVIFVIWVVRRTLFAPPYSPLVDYQHLGPPALVPSIEYSSDPTLQRAVVTTLYSDSYAIGAAVLGHSLLTIANTTASRLLLAYLPGRISEEALCVVGAAGWTPVPVPFIPPPHGGRGIYHRFADQYTKLNIWALPASRAVYLDADTLVKRNFDELFDMPWSFGAVPDMYGDKRGFTVGFNAGVLVYRPDETVLERMKSVLEQARYPLQQAEQAFLNVFFAGSAVRLPYAYNANLAIKKISPALWEGMKDEIRIVHYTLVKPFVDDDDQSGKMIEDDGRLHQIIDDASRAQDGRFSEEIGWWRDVYQAMNRSEVGKKIKACRRI